MTNEDTIKFLRKMKLKIKGSKLCPMGRPLLIVRDTDGKEWWLSATHVQNTNLLGDAK